jgi:hypothetical protein
MKLAIFRPKYVIYFINTNKECMLILINTGYVRLIFACNCELWMKRRHEDGCKELARAPGRLIAYDFRKASR